MAQQVEGLSRLLKDLEAFGEEGARLTVAVTNATAETIVNQAKSRAPVNYGQLRQSIGKTTARVKPIVYNISYVFANAPYAP